MYPKAIYAWSKFPWAMHSRANDPENTIIPKIFIQVIGVDITSFE